MSPKFDLWTLAFQAGRLLTMAMNRPAICVMMGRNWVRKAGEVTDRILEHKPHEIEMFEKYGAFGTKGDGA